jgi:outer membrane biosynthesis protein TonB
LKDLVLPETTTTNQPASQPINQPTKTNKQTSKQANKETKKQKNKETNKQASKQTNKQTNERTNKQTNKQQQQQQQQQRKITNRNLHAKACTYLVCLYKLATLLRFESPPLESSPFTPRDDLTLGNGKTKTRK